MNGHPQNFAPVYHVAMDKRYSTGHDQPQATTRIEWELASQKSTVLELTRAQDALQRDVNDIGGDLKLVLELVKSLRSMPREPTPHISGCLLQFSINRVETFSIVISFNPSAPRAVAHFTQLVKQKKYVGAKLFTAVDTDSVARCFFEDPTHQAWAEEELLEEPEETKFERSRGRVYLVAVRNKLRGNDFFFPLVDGTTRCSRVLVGEIKSGLNLLDMIYNRLKTDQFYLLDTQLC